VDAVLNSPVKAEFDMD